jgi:hypothetical protein
MNFQSPLRASLLALGAAGLLACSSSVTPSEKTSVAASELAALVPIASCGELEDAIREMAIRDMNAAIDAAEKGVLQRADSECSDHEYDSYGYASPSASATAGAANEDAPSGGPKSTTGTNNQVSGVDEADFVKNDGKHLYVAANGALRILRSWPADQTAPIASVPLEGTPKKLFLDGDRVLVYVSVGGAAGDPGYDGYPGYAGGGRECTYGYDCDFRGDGTATRLVVFDVSDRTSPKKVRTVDLSGSLVAARKIGHAVHTVVSQGLSAFPSLPTYPDGAGYVSCNASASEVESALAAFETLRAENIRTIRTTKLTEKLPTMTDSVGAAPVGECKGFYRSPLGDGSDVLSIVSLDMTAETPAHAASVLSRPGAVYGSAGSLYIAVPHDFSGYDSFSAAFGAPEITTVHRFAVGSDPAATAYAASGPVAGRVLNQFSMDEHEQSLRIATTSGHLPDPSATNTLTVLQQSGAYLTTAGTVGNFAQGEDIRSVRFEGPSAYVVTFKKTDPLWAFDLSDPHAPRIAGELQIPGFSTYIHKMDATHLLTIGFDANDHGEFAFFDGVILQIFDVSNPAAPALVQKTKIGTRGSSSEALTNHLAFTYAADRGLLALPMTICEGGGDGTYGSDMTFSGLMVFGVDVAKGFTEIGRVAHPNAPDGNGYDSGTCGNWWADASSEVKRTIFMDDFVYSISESVVKVEALSKMGVDVASAPLQ